MTKQQAPEAEEFSLEFLMSTPPTELSKLDLDMIVQYHRNVRADRAAAAQPGAKRKRASTPSAAMPTGIKKLITASVPKINRRGL